MSTARTAIVAGGGIAGIATALHLADRGVAVTLLEARRRLGGRATSFVDAKTGDEIDNCQHVVLGCCTAYLALCERLGVLDRFEWHAEQFWVEAGGRESVIRPGRLPAPGHFAGSFLAARFLTAGEKAAIGAGMIAIGAADRAAWRGRTFADVLARLRQPQGAVQRFWRPVVVSACNAEPERADAGLALKVFQDGFLAGADEARMGLSLVPLARLYDAAAEAIAAAGGSVRHGVSVERLWRGGVVTAAGDTLVADAVVCALPPERAARVVDPAERRGDPRFIALDAIEHTPILGVHLAFDRPVMARPHAVLVDRPTQWAFAKPPSDGRFPIHAVVSAADEWMDLPEATIVRRVMEDLEACFPQAWGGRPPTLLHARAVKERRATFAPTPAFEATRPTTAGSDGRGIILAGDYVAVGWPATMEGAARSGARAAEATLGLDPGRLGDLAGGGPLFNHLLRAVGWGP